MKTEALYKPALVAAALVITTPSSLAADIYGIKSKSAGGGGTPQWETPSILYRYPDTGGTLVRIGNIRTSGGADLRADGLAYWPGTGMWCFEVTGQGVTPVSSTLRPLNPLTAVAGTGVALPGRHIFGAAFDLSGRLWAMDQEADALIRLVPSTGQVLETVGLSYNASPFDLTYGTGDIAFDATGQLWLVYGSDFYKIDLSTGVMTLDQRVPGISLYMVGAVFSPADDSHIHVFDASDGWYNDDLLRFDIDDSYSRHNMYLEIYDGEFNAGRGDLTVVPSTAPPTLTITPSGGDLILSWPQFPTGWLLNESATAGGAPSPWAEISPPYGSDGVNHTHTIAAPTGSHYYRLQK